MDRNDFDHLADQLPIGRHPAAVRRRVEALEKLLERSFVIPGTRQPVGLDALLGLIPVVGDIVAGALGAWLVWEARQLGMSRLHLSRMIGNIGLDTALGAVPLVGDLFDLAYRSNSRNLRIIKRWLDKHHPETGLVEGEVVARRDL